MPPMSSNEAATPAARYPPPGGRAPRINDIPPPPFLRAARRARLNSQTRRAADEVGLYGAAVRRHRDWRGTQRPRHRGVSRPRKKESRRPRATPRSRGSGGHGGALSGIQVHRLLVRVQPPPPADHPRSRSAIPRLRSDPARIEFHAAPRRALPVLSRVRRGYLPSGRESLAAGRGGEAEGRPPHGPHGGGYRAPPPPSPPRGP